MLDRLFHRHPRSVGETYLQHLRAASVFAGTLIVAGLACLVHALVPALFVDTGSRLITRLHNRMVVQRARGATASPDARS